jgi:hypothetical protein
MAKHIVETQLDKRTMQSCVAMLASMGYEHNNQRSSVNTLGFFGLRRTDLLEIAERFDFDVDPATEAIVIARHFESLYLQGKFGVEPEVPEEKLSARQLMAEAKILGVNFIGKSHAALSREVGEAKVLLYEQAKAAEIIVTDKTLAELVAAMKQESDHGTLPSAPDAAQRDAENGDSGGPEQGGCRADVGHGFGGTLGSGEAGSQEAGNVQGLRYPHKEGAEA